MLPTVQNQCVASGEAVESNSGSAAVAFAISTNLIGWLEPTQAAAALRGVCDAKLKDNN